MLVVEHASLTGAEVVVQEPLGVVTLDRVGKSWSEYQLRWIGRGLRRGTELNAVAFEQSRDIKVRADRLEVGSEVRQLGKQRATAEQCVDFLP